MVPYIPFIKGYVDFLFGTLLGLNIITGGNYVFNKMIHVHRIGKEVGGCRPPGFHSTGAWRYSLRSHRHDPGLLFPSHSRYPFLNWSFRRQPVQSWIHPFHDLGGLAGKPSVLLGRFMSDLPGAIHLISQIPQPDIVRLLITILNPQITPVSAGRKIAVLHQIPGGVRSPWFPDLPPSSHPCLPCGSIHRIHPCPSGCFPRQTRRVPYASAFLSFGPIPSSQLYPETKLPPG